jgi:S1-C subfamily serine protease
MRLVAFSVVFISLLFASGCRSLLKPSTEERNASYAAIASAMNIDADQMLKRTYFVLSGGEDLRLKKFSPSADGNGAHFETEGVSEQGLAVAIAEDGYLLTASHVVKD